MSSMLEQAIVDAEALREAAVKNAETLVLEKYSDKIRNVVESLLEEQEEGAEEDPLAGLGEDMGEDPEAEAEEEPSEPISPVTESIPFAATQDLDEEIEIPLDKLFEQISDLAQIVEEEEPEDDDEVLSEIDDDLLEFLAEEDDSDEEVQEEGKGAACPDCGNVHEGACVKEEMGPDGAAFEDLDETFDHEGADVDEDQELEESILDALSEELMVDIAPARSGWAGTPDSVYNLAEEEMLALEQDSRVREERAAKRAAVNKLKNMNESLKTRNKEMLGSLEQARDYMTRLRDTVVVLKEKLDDMSVSNARLLYTNKALESASLNERQKNKLVEAISNAETIEEAKVIFETLQNAVGSTSRKQQPKSLSEAVQKPSSMILAGRSNSRSRSRKESPTFDRWKFLAGIDKN